MEIMLNAEPSSWMDEITECDDTDEAEEMEALTRMESGEKRENSGR